MTVPPVDGASDAPIVRLERMIPATPDALFGAWTDPALLRRWMSPVGHAEATVDLRVGGALHVAMVDGGVRIEHTGEFLEVERPTRLRFTWNSSYTGASPSVVTVTLAPEGEQTRLVLVHERLPVDAVKSHEGGWGAMVERLVGVLADLSGQGAIQ